MLKTLDAPRADYKDHAPRIISFNVPNDMIGAIIGPGGKIIQEIQKTTTANISIEELENGEGRVEVTSDNGTAMKEAVDWVKKIAFPPVVEVGETYEGKVKTIMAYGAFVEIIPGQDGLLHISELAWDRVDKVEDVLKEGETIEVKLIAIDERSGKLKLSRKVLLPKPEKK
jgi:polyribonucleotide nucleotidyltransferase